MQFAAQEMSKYLEMISGVSFEVTNDTGTSLNRIVIGQNNPLVWNHAAEMALDSVKDDGFRILTMGSDLYIAGTIDRGVLYGVYHFLDFYLGLRWYSPDFEVVPSSDSLALGAINDLENPDFIHREMFNQNTDEPYYRQRNRLNGSRMHRNPFYNNYPEGINTWSDYCKSGPSGLNNGGHNMQKVVSNTSYHSGGQLLMMSQACREDASETFTTTIPQYGSDIWYGFDQMDNGWTPDEASKDFAHAHGGVLSAPLLDMLTDVADRVRLSYPDARLATSAYQWSFSPPSGLTIPDYVMVQLAPIHSNFGYAYNAPENSEINSDIQKWNQLVENISVWDYVANYQNYLQPLPNIYPMCKNIKYFAGLEHVKGYMAQSSYNTSGAEFADLRAWVAARLLWDSELDYQALVYEFIEGYYGEAAYYIKQYVDALHNSFELTEDRLSVKQRISSDYLSLDFIMLADQLLASADGVATGPYAQHVHEVRMGVDMAILLMEHIYKEEAEERGITWTEDPGRRTRFNSYVSEANVSFYNEGSEISSLFTALDIEHVAPDVPDVAEKLKDGDWIDFQDLDLKMCCGANLVEDTLASYHSTVKMPANGVWSTQMSLDLLPSNGKWRLYAYVRVDPKSSGSVAFSYGVSPGSSKDVSRSAVADGKYHLIEFPENPYSFETGRYLWFAGSSAISNLYIDRIVAVRDGLTGVDGSSAFQNFFKLNAYPNPINSSTTLSYSLAVSSQVDLRIYSANGQLVKTLLSSVQSPGQHELVFSSGELAAGVYYCRLCSEGRSESIKMIVK